MPPPGGESSDQPGLKIDPPGGILNIIDKTIHLIISYYKPKASYYNQLGKGEQ